MKKTIKWISISLGGLIIVVTLVLLIAPRFIDIQKYKPEIEKLVTEATGRPFTLAGDLKLSLFPVAVLSFSDLHLGNPEGFREKDFIAIKSFDARVKLLPLISRDIQIMRFVVEGPRIVLEKRKDGRGNWQGLGEPRDTEIPVKAKEGKKPSPGKTSGGLPIHALAVGELSITDGRILWIDHASGQRKEVAGLTVRLQDVSLDRPIHLALSARLDNKPISLEGDVGPIGKEPGKGPLPLDLAVKALDQLNISLKGKIMDPMAGQQFDLALQIAPFSPRKVLSALGQPLSLTTADPKALSRVALKAGLKGDPGALSISGGALDLDESKLAFSLKVKDFDKPDIAFDLKLDNLDLDRYLPPASEKNPAAPPEAQTPKPGRKKTDYAPLRKLVLQGAVRVGALKAHGLKIQDLNLNIKGRNGLFNLDPLALKLYQGRMSVTGAFDVRQDIPVSKASLDAGAIQAGALLKDFLKKDFLEGTLQAKVDISMQGDDPDRIKRTLAGNGDLLFKDGAIVGIDIGGMVRNVKATFGLAEKGEARPRTEFAELHAPFTITGGLLETSDTRLLSPLLRVQAAGKADLVKEDIDLRVEPKLVSSLKGQGDTMDRSGVLIPVLVTGTFSSPKFRPDLQGMLKQTLTRGLPKPEDLLKGQGIGKLKELEEKAKGLLKGFSFGR